MNNRNSNAVNLLMVEALGLITSKTEMEAEEQCTKTKHRPKA
jgi:hypothetical protein